MKWLDKEILRLSVPAIVSNITVPLLGLCDTAISGHLGSEVYLAAIAVGSMMLNVIFWLFGFLRMGTTGLTAKAFGAGDGSGISKVFSRAAGLGIGIGVVLILLRVPLMKGLLYIIAADEGVTRHVENYFSICVWEAPALLATMAISGWFVGMQSTFYPMVIAISVNLINIVASLTFVFGFGMGFEGIPYGTLSANWAGFVMAIVMAFRFSRGKRLWCGWRGLFKGGGMSKFFSVNVNLFIRSACIISVSLGVTAAGARLGALTLAINAVLMQFFTFFSFFMDGFAFSGEALTGRFSGARDTVMFRSSVRHLLVWTLIAALVFTAAYVFGYSPATYLLTDDEGVRRGVEEMRIWIWLMPMVSVWAFVYDGFYVGITDTSKMMWATLMASLVFFAVAFIHVSGSGIRVEVASNGYVWSAFLGYLLVRGTVLAAIWPGVVRRLKFT